MKINGNLHPKNKIDINITQAKLDRSDKNK